MKTIVETAETVQSQVSRPRRAGFGKGRAAFWLNYSLLFCVMTVIIFLPFVLSGRSLVNKTDGLTQYIVYLRYMGQYLRSALGSILSGDFSIPAYDFSIGMGDEIGQIVRFHPLDFLSVFVPSAYTEQLYTLILFLRYYLAGLSFSAFAFYIGKRSPSLCSGDESSLRIRKLSDFYLNRFAINVLSGAMVYIFCGYMLMRVANHPTYAAPFIVFPLLLTGAERIMRKEGFLLFPLMVFLGFWSNYYFMYIMSFGLLLYVLVRFWDLYQEDRVRSFFKLFVQMSLLYLLGLFMSMATLLPTVYRYTSSARSSSSLANADLWIYSDKRRYFAWILNLISPFQSSGNGLNLNYPVIVIPCLAALFAFFRKKLRSLKVFLIMCFAVILIPALGYVLAVFNRENNRWMFLLSLCLGMCVVFTAESFSQMGKKAWLFLGMISAVYVAGVLCQFFMGGINRYNLIGAIELIIADVILFWLREKKSIWMCRAVFLITCSSAAVNGFVTYTPSMGNVSKDYIKAGTTLLKYENFWGAVAASGIDDPDFYRVDVLEVPHRVDNSAQFAGYNGTSEYNSILNASMIEALDLVNDKDLEAFTTLHGLNGRPVSLNLAHSRYLIARMSNSALRPWGYTEDLSLSTQQAHVYRNNNPLAFGFSYDSFITWENYMALSPLDREMVQLYAAVIDDTDESGQKLVRLLREEGMDEITDYSAGIIEESAVIDQWNGAEYTDGVIRVSQKKATAMIRADQKAGYECYLSLDGLVSDSERSTLAFHADGIDLDVLLRNENELYNLGRDDYLVHLGYSDIDAERQIQITFKVPRSYHLDGVRVLYVPMHDSDNAINALNEESLKEEVITDGRVEGRMNLSSGKLVVFSVPWAKGWHLEIDGERADLWRADVMYLAALPGEGEHTICLTYEIPGAKTGMYLALAAGVAWIMLAIWRLRFRKTRRY